MTKWKEGSEFTQTIGMLAQRQPSFKQCVTADLSSEFAPKKIGTKSYAEVVDLRKRVVEERSNVGRSLKGTEDGRIRSENPGMSNDKQGENPYRRKDKVSLARFVR